MKRYWLFCMFEYYPAGGVRDFHAAFTGLDDACSAGSNLTSWNGEVSPEFYDYQVLDIQTGKVYYSNGTAGQLRVS